MSRRNVMKIDVHQVEVEQEILEQMLVIGGKTLVSNSVLAALLAYMQTKVLPMWIPLTWLTAVTGVNFVRYILGNYYLKHPADSLRTIRKRMMRFRAGLFLVAAIWSLSYFLVYEHSMRTQHLDQLLFVAYMLAGLSAGAAVVYCRDMVSSLIFTAVSVFPMLLSFAFSQHETLVAMALAGFLYTLFIIISIRSHNQSLVEGVQLKHQAIQHADEVEQLAFYDELTKLPNRRLLLERLEHAFVQGWRTGKRSALLFIDLDNFKQLNDTEGHDVGDMLLIKVANRLVESVRASDTVSRFGGDEFVLILNNLNEHYGTAVQETKMIAEQILTKLNQPYQLVDLEYQTTPSIGVAMFVTHGRTQQDLLKHADIAMYAAKQSGGNNYHFFDESLASGQ